MSEEQATVVAQEPPPRVDGLPLVGVVPWLLRDALSTLEGAVQRHGDAVRLRLGRRDAFLFVHPDHVHEILAEKARVYTKESSLWAAAQRLVGRGIGTTDGSFWLEHRRAMQPQFHRSRFADISRLMAAAIREELDELGGRARRRIVLFDELRSVVSRVFLRTLLGASIDRAETGALVQAVNDSFASLHKLLWTSSLPPWVPVPGLRRFHSAVATIDAIVYRVLDERRARPSAEDDLLNLILQSFSGEAGDAAGRQHIRDEVATMLVASVDGPSIGLSWAFTLLGRHPEAAARLQREIAEVLGNRAIAADDIDRLTYTRAVVEEALRLYPPLWLSVRMAAADDTVAGHRIPRGALVFVSSFLTHRHPDFWSQPEVFDPERFLGEAPRTIHRGAYLPFGLGPHLCIGKHYGLMFGQMFLAEFHRRFRLRFAGDTDFEPRGMVSLRPRREIYAEVERI